MSFGAGDASGPVDWLTAGPPAGPPDRRRRGVLAGVLLIAVAAGVLGPALWVRDRQDEPAPGSAPTPSSTLRPTRAPTSPASPVARPQVVYRSGPLLPGRTTDWELFARSEDTVYRIEVGAGRVTATQHERLATSGPVTFVADAGGVILRPLDGVAGYAVPNGRSARPLRGLLAKGG